MLARGQLELPVTLCYAASRGDDFLMHQLLKRGVDPNESDNYWHTALVIKKIVIFLMFLLPKLITNLQCSLLVWSIEFNSTSQLPVDMSSASSFC